MLLCFRFLKERSVNKNRATNKETRSGGHQLSKSLHKYSQNCFRKVFLGRELKKGKSNFSDVQKFFWAERCDVYLAEIIGVGVSMVSKTVLWTFKVFCYSVREDFSATKLCSCPGKCVSPGNFCSDKIVTPPFWILHTLERRSSITCQVSTFMVRTDRFARPIM